MSLKNRLQECSNNISDFQLLDIKSDQNKDCVNSEAAIEF